MNVHPEVGLKFGEIYLGFSKAPFQIGIQNFRGRFRILQSLEMM